MNDKKPSASILFCALCLKCWKILGVERHIFRSKNRHMNIFSLLLYIYSTLAIFLRQKSHLNPFFCMILHFLWNLLRKFYELEQWYFAFFGQITPSSPYFFCIYIQNTCLFVYFFTFFLSTSELFLCKIYIFYFWHYNLISRYFCIINTKMTFVLFFDIFHTLFYIRFFLVGQFRFSKHIRTQLCSYPDRFADKERPRVRYSDRCPPRW